MPKDTASGVGEPAPAGTGPYVVTARRECEYCEGSGTKSELPPCTTFDRDCACNAGYVHQGACVECIIASRAFETLEQARTLALGAVRGWRDAAATREAWEQAYDSLKQCSEITDQGGVVGPLPDGTTITVSVIPPAEGSSDARP